MIVAFGPNSDNWIGKALIISRGITTYSGKDVACVVIEPVVATRIAAAPQRPALGEQRRGSTTITSGRQPPTPPMPPPIEDVPDMPDLDPGMPGFDSDIPF